MSCPSCSHTMHQMGCRSTDLPFFWCPRCGTIKNCDAVVGVPVLLERCREFEKTLGDERASNAVKWHALGIEESIRPVKEHP
jgi:hypothetical protein